MLIRCRWRVDQINRLLFAIKAIYHAPNPYHNYVHAIDVLQATYSFLVNLGVAPPWDYIRDLTPGASAWKRPDERELPVCGLGTRRAREVLRPQDVFGVMVAAMGHDVGHPGLSNAFMVSHSPVVIPTLPSFGLGLMASLHLTERLTWGQCTEKRQNAAVESIR